MLIFIKINVIQASLRYLVWIKGYSSLRFKSGFANE